MQLQYAIKKSTILMITHVSCVGISIKLDNIIGNGSMHMIICTYIIMGLLITWMTKWYHMTSVFAVALFWWIVREDGQICEREEYESVQEMNAMRILRGAASRRNMRNFHPVC